jgi:hypothetical protein
MMPSETLNDIENEFKRLSPEAQLSLLERLRRWVRVSAPGRRDPWEKELSAMSADPQVRREIDSFNDDTRITEADGLRGE